MGSSGRADPAIRDGRCYARSRWQGLRVLVPGDEARLFEFRAQHVDTSLFFFSNIEKAGLVDRGPALEEGALHLVRSWRERGSLWVLTLGDEVVSMTGFNAETRGIVQVGGVYTPPALRSRGYARAAVAGSLKLARKKGATRSVLFTPEENPASQAAYRALGYAVTGDFGLVLF